jgi:riboflavin kinase/FMN adenylyltransferase
VKVVRDIADFRPPGQPVALTLGFFDGVHRGHQALISELRAAAARIGGTSLLLTFDSHPFRVVCPDKLPPMITTLTERLQHLDHLGVEHVVIQSFDRMFAELSADYFIRELLVRKLRARAVVGGYDTRFGRDREGDHDMLRAYAAREGYEFDDVAPLEIEGEIVSSTAIRRAIQAGELDHAARLLGRPWTVWSHVVPGRGVGRHMGFPTANLEVGYLVMPRSGVYASYIHAQDRVYRGLMYVGTQPTFQHAARTTVCEVYLMDFAGDLYEEWLRVEPVTVLRGDTAFDSPDELRAQIAADVEKTHSILEDPCGRTSRVRGHSD